VLQENHSPVLQTLLTGFGPFLSVVDNPSERLTHYFQAHPVPGHTLTTRILPVSFRDATGIVQQAIAAGGTEGQRFDLILMLGVAAKRPHWSVECTGRNRSTTSVADAENSLWPYACIVGDAPEILAATLPAEALVSAIAAVGLPAIASEDAGDYLCNHLLFWTLSHLQTRKNPARAGFLHVPADTATFAPDVVSDSIFTFQQHCAAVQAVLEALTPSVGDHQVDL
jgi:pyroglutamyl-peptidase